MITRHLLALAVSAALVPVALPSAAAAERARPNVLFIAIDDLRSDLGVLGVKHARTPNLDRFAASGRLFTHHYAVVPTCGASRCSLMRGRYPDQLVQVGNEAIRLTHESWGAQSLPAWWRQHGYQTLALGKITHYPGNLTGRNWAEGPEELPGAWDRTWIPKSPWKTSEEMMHGYANGRPRVPGKSPAWQMNDGPDDAYPDAWVAGDAVRTLGELATSNKPWFFAVGLYKPHLPFAAPKKWFDLHDPKDIAAPEVTTRPVAIRIRMRPTRWNSAERMRRRRVTSMRRWGGCWRHCGNSASSRTRSSLSGAITAFSSGSTRSGGSTRSMRTACVRR